MPTKIKLMRRGKMRQPYYRIVVADSRTKRDGRSIEEIGKYHPKEDPSYMEVDAERIAYWLGVGAQPTDAVRAILKVTGDWQKFYGEPAPEPMRVKAAKPDRRAAFEAATQHAAGQPEAEATTPKKKTAPKAAAQSKAGESATESPASAPDSPTEDAAEESPATPPKASGSAAPAESSDTDESNADKPEPAAESKPKAAAKAAPKVTAKSADKPAAGPADDSAEPVVVQDSDG